MALYDYRWAAGWNVALASLSNVENDLRPYVRLRSIAPKSQPVDPFPVRTVLGSGKVRGDGRIDHAWILTLNTAALEYIIETKFALTSTASVKATIYTRRHEMNDYQRYNCWLVRPSPANGDLEYARQGVFRVTLRFTGLLSL